MSTYSNEYVIKVIESLGEMLTNKDNKITCQEYEIKRLKNKIEAIEQYVDFYSKGNNKHDANASNNKVTDIS